MSVFKPYAVARKVGAIDDLSINLLVVQAHTRGPGVALNVLRIRSSSQLVALYFLLLLNARSDSSECSGVRVQYGLGRRLRSTCLNSFEAVAAGFVREVDNGLI